MVGGRGRPRGGLSAGAGPVEAAHGAVDGQHVQVAVVVEVQPAGAEAGHCQAGCVESRDHAGVREQTAAVVQVEGARLAGDVGHVEVLVAVAVQIAGIDAHPGFGFAPAVDRRAREQSPVLEAAAAKVHPHLVRRAVVGDVEVEPAVEIEIGGHGAEAVAVLGCDASPFRCVLEAPVAEVAEQAVRFSPVRLRAAVVRFAAAEGAHRVAAEIEVHVVGDEQVQRAVAVVVEEGRGDAPPGIVGAGGLRRILEPPSAQVAPEAVRPEVRHVQVGPAVAVVVRGGHAHAVAGGVEARVRGDVDEAEFAAFRQFVPEQAVAGGGAVGRGRGARRQVGALHQVRVQIAVAIEVEERRAGAHDLGQQEPSRAAVPVSEGEADLSGALFEGGGRRVVRRRRFGVGFHPGAFRAARGGERQQGDACTDHRSVKS